MVVVEEAGSQPVRGAKFAKKPDSSFDGVHKRSCSQDIHIQEEEVEERETHGREQGEEKRQDKQSLRRMTHGWDDEPTLEPMWHHTSFSTRSVQEKK